MFDCYIKTTCKYTQWVRFILEVMNMENTISIRELRKQLGDTQSEFAERYNIPFLKIDQSGSKDK